jgi:hypothetical protein
MERVTKKHHKEAGGHEGPAKVPGLRPERRKQAFSVLGGAVERAGDAGRAADA